MDCNNLSGSERKLCLQCSNDLVGSAANPRNPQLGAPNLTDKIWLHGAAEPSIVETITNGRNSQMPAHKAFLSEAKLHVLAAYVYGLSNQPQK